MYTQESLQALDNAEKSFVFEAITHDMCLELGQKLVADAKAFETRPIAVRIILDDNIVFQYLMNGTNAENIRWMDRKCATVLRSGHCSLRRTVLNELQGKVEPWMADESHYAFCGGAFPIKVNGVLRGIACISGLPHLMDHKRLSDTIASFLGKETIAVPVEQ